MSINKLSCSLQGINIASLNKKYGLVPNTENEEIEKSFHIEQQNVSFLSETKQPVNCSVSSINFMVDTTDLLIKYNCYWCRHPVSSFMLGCPISHIPLKAIKTYQSHISHDTYTIKENISRVKSKIQPENKDVQIVKHEEYETDGVFCSGSCCLAYIKENKHNHIYDNSEILLKRIWKQIYGPDAVLIPAPHWRLLREYGGYMSIVQFRDTSNNIEFINQGTVKMTSIGTMYEKKYRL